MSTLVYRFGLLPPHENDALVRSQMRLAHRYRNDLVQIERARRAAVRDVARAAPEVARLELEAARTDAACAKVGGQIKAARAAGRTRKDSVELIEQLKALRIEHKEVVLALREARKTARVAAEPVLAEIEERVAAMRRGARAICGVYWGTYLMIEDADQAMRKMPLYDKDAEPSDPRFVPWTGDGSVGVQIQGGMTGEDTADDTRLRIESAAPPPGADPNSKRSLRRRYCVLAMRVGSEGRDPVWARWRMVMERPLPADARIKRAAVKLRRVGPREEWSVTITLETAERDRRVSDQVGMVGIDLGWRLMPDGLRVAAWHGSDGASGFLTLPDTRPTFHTTPGGRTRSSALGVVDAARKVEDLSSKRDKAFNEARSAIARIEGAPPWFELATKTISQWKSQGRLAALVRRWRDARWDGDAEAYEEAEKWRYHDHHLWAWETSQQAKALRARREVFRLFAADMAKRYARLAIEGLDLRAFARKTDDDTNETARRNRVVVAPSKLREALLLAFGSAINHWAETPKGDRVVVVEAAGTTMVHHECGSVERWDQATHVSHLCSSCGEIFDQDANAAKNILAAGERLGGPVLSGAARNDENVSNLSQVREGRWAKAKRMKAEKDARLEAARKAAPSAAE
jgi:hypothetical protein